MIKVTVTINFHGKKYVTNVLTDRDTSETAIQQIAFEQVKKQWAC